MPSIGIDLGTTHAYVAVSQNGKVTVIENDQERRVPSCVAFSSNERLIGAPAVHQMSRNLQNTLYDVKRILGRNFDDDEAEEWKNHHASQVVQNGKEGKLKVLVEYAGSEKKFYLEEITAMLLVNLKKIAEKYLGDDQVTGAVITVPASFNNLQRQATLDAAAIAGIHVNGLINETTAIALNCSLRHEVTQKRNILICHMGGGTFHASVVVLEEKTVKVLAADGRSNFGGKDFTEELFKKAAKQFAGENARCKVSTSGREGCRLRSACEKAKCELSHSTSTSVKIDAIMHGKDFNMEVSRKALHDLTNKNVDEILKSIDKAMEQAKLNESQIDDVYLVGGGTRMIVFQEKFIKKFHRFESKIRKTLNVDEAAVLGAAAYAEMISGSSSSSRTTDMDGDTAISCYVIDDIVPFSIEVDYRNGRPEVIFKRERKVKRERHICTSNDERPALKVYEIDDRKHLIGDIEIGKYLAKSNGVDISFQVDTDGLLQVTIDTGTERCNADVCRGIKKQELRELAKNAKKFEDQEENKRKDAQALHLYERFVYEKKRSAEDGNRQLGALCDEELNWIRSSSNATEDSATERREKFQHQYHKIISAPEETVATNEVTESVKVADVWRDREKKTESEPTGTEMRQLPIAVSLKEGENKVLPGSTTKTQNIPGKALRFETGEGLKDGRKSSLADQNLPSKKTEAPQTTQLQTRVSSAEKKKKKSLEYANPSPEIEESKTDEKLSNPPIMRQTEKNGEDVQILDKEVQTQLIDNETSAQKPSTSPAPVQHQQAHDRESGLPNIDTNVVAQKDPQAALAAKFTRPDLDKQSGCAVTIVGNGGGETKAANTANNPKKNSSKTTVRPSPSNGPARNQPTRKGPPVQSQQKTSADDKSPSAKGKDPLKEVAATTKQNTQCTAVAEARTKPTTSNANPVSQSKPAPVQKKQQQRGKTKKK